MTIQVIIATAVARFVLITAAAASAPAKYGSPPLKPFQPSQRMPAPTATNTQVVRHRLLAVPLQPRPDHRGGDEAGHAGREVDHVAAAEVQRALAGPEAAAPEQERVHRVGERDPQRHEDQPDLELDPPDHAADEQDRRDRREHELEVDQRALAGT